LWHHWDINEKPQKHLLKVTDKKGRYLFFSSTIMIVGNGKNTLFWKSRWLNGLAPKETTPNLFQIARFKKRYVYKELLNNNWIRNLQNVQSLIQLEEFTNLFMTLSSISLNEQNDEIRWRWIADGKYPVSFAYECQF
jgi:hypothetical protein